MKKTNLLLLLLGMSLTTGLVFSYSQNHQQYFKASATDTDMSSVELEDGETLDTAHEFYDDFSSGISSSSWGVEKRKWGLAANHGGVRPENTFYNSLDDTVIFRALGNYYNEAEFVNDNENIHSSDGTRTGAVIKTKELLGPGRFEIKAKLAPFEGICNAFWLFNYGLDGATYYNEIDFEMPGRTTSGTPVNSYNRVICSTYETEEIHYSPHLTSKFLNDDEFHTYCFDWYYSASHKKVNFFIDGELFHSSTTNVSPYYGRISIGCWIPYNANFTGIPNFDKGYMELDYFKYTPFTNQQGIRINSEADYIVDTYTTVAHSFTNNLLPNAGFKNGLSSGYTQTNDVTVSTSLDKDGGSTYGVKLCGLGNSNTSKIETTVANVYGLKTLTYSFDYKGRGSSNFYYNGSNKVLATGNLTSVDAWSKYEGSVILPKNATTLKAELLSSSSGTGLTIDNLSLTIKDVYEFLNDNAYGFYTKNNVTDSSLTWGEKTLSPDGDGSHSFKLAKGRYFNSGSVDAIALAPTSTVMGSSEESVYYPIKTALKNASLFTDSDKVSCFMMLFDINHFDDIEYVFTKYTLGERSLSILYSIDEGLSWNVIKTVLCSSLVDSGISGFEYSLRTTSSEIASAHRQVPIRFAIVGAEMGNDDSDLLTSIIINNYQLFKNYLDSSMCNAEEETIEFLAHQYDMLASSELTLLASENMALYNQTYQEGYNYLLSHWGREPLPSPLALFSDSQSLITITVIFLLVVTAFSLLIIKKKKHQ